MLERGASRGEISALLEGADLGVTPTELRAIIDRIFKDGVPEGRLILSDARQWRLRYGEALRERARKSGAARVPPNPSDRARRR